MGEQTVLLAKRTQGITPAHTKNSYRKLRFFNGAICFIIDSLQVEGFFFVEISFCFFSLKVLRLFLVPLKFLFKRQKINRICNMALFGALCFVSILSNFITVHSRPPGKLYHLKYVQGASFLVIFLLCYLSNVWVQFSLNIFI